MPKQHKDWDKIGITWSGGLDHPDAGNQNQSIPGSIEDTPLISLGTWGKTISNIKILKIHIFNYTSIRSFL
jgi:hypothetical protein